MKDVSVMGPSALQQAMTALRAAQAAHPVAANIIKAGLIYLAMKHAGALKALLGSAGGAE